METPLYINLPPDGKEYVITGRMAQWLKDFTQTETNPFVRIEAMAVTLVEIKEYCDAKQRQLAAETIALLRNKMLTVKETGELLRDYSKSDISDILGLPKLMNVWELIRFLEDKASIDQTITIAGSVKELLYLPEPDPDLGEQLALPI